MKKHKVIRHIIISVLLALLVEGLIFGFPYLYKNYIKGCNQTELSLADFALYNWTDGENGGYISLPDPMVIVENLKVSVDEMDIVVNCDAPVSGITVFYTESDDQVFTAEHAIAAGDYVGNVITVSVDRFVNDLRIDLGEADGTHLNDMSVILNPDRITFSISRIITVIILYFSTLFLFRLQKRPDYTELEDDADERS